MITQIRLINCQSWKDTTISLASDKLNVIRGANNVGKSVLYKMLKISADPKYYSKSKRSDLIRWGSDCASILYALDNESVIMVSVYRNCVIYSIKREGEECWEKYYEPTDEMLREIGLLVNREDSFIANIIDANQDLLLVDSKLSGNYSLIRLLVCDETLDCVKQRIADLKPQLSDGYSTLTREIAFLESKCESILFSDVEKMKIELEVMECCERVMYDLIDVYNYLESVCAVIEGAKDFDGLLKFVGVLQSLGDLCVEQCIIPKKPVPIELVDGLQSLEDLCVEKCVIPKKPVPIELVSVLQSLEDLRIEQCTVLKEPVPIEVCSILESIEDLRDSLIILEEKEVPVSLEVAVSVLESLESLCVERVYIKPIDFVGLLSMEKVCHSLRGVAQFIDTCNTNWEKSCNCEKVIEVLESEFIGSGEPYQCPIYGEVVYDGKDCIPYS